MIEAKNINKKYGEQVILENFNLDAKPGDFVGVVGRTGCGKSTLLNILGGYEFCDSGDVIFNGEKHNDLKTKGVNKLRKRKIAFLFQEYNLLSNLSVYENLKMSIGFNRKEFHKINDYLKKMDLMELKHKKVSKLSGGEKQRIAFIRAMIKDFDVLICDEPTGNLDDTNSKLILDLIKEECKNKIVIIVTHKKSIANSYFNKKYVYDNNDKSFILTQDERVDIKDDFKIRSVSKLSIFGLAKHCFSRLKSKLFYNILILILVTMFIISFSLSGIFSEGMFRRIQINYEKQYLPLDEVSFNAEGRYIDRLSTLEEVGSVSKKQVLDISYKFYTWPYQGIGGSLESVGDEISGNDSIIKVDAYTDNQKIDSFNFGGRCLPGSRKIIITELTSDDDFVYDNILIGDYPKEDEVLIDATLANELLGFPYYNNTNYNNGKLTGQEIYNVVKGQYLQFYTVTDIFINDEGKKEQRIEFVRYRVAGVLDVRHNSKYLRGVYAPTKALEEMTSFVGSIDKSSYVIYKTDDLRVTHEYLMDSLDFNYDIDQANMELYKEAYQKVKSVVDINLLLAQFSTIVFIIGVVILLTNIFSKNKYEIAIYRSLGFSTPITSIILGLNYIVTTLLGVVLAYLSNEYVFSRLLNYSNNFDEIFINYSFTALFMLTVIILTILFYNVLKNDKKPINSLIK